MADSEALPSTVLVPTAEATPEEDTAWLKLQRPPRYILERLRSAPEFLAGIVILSLFTAVAIASAIHYGGALFVLTPNPSWQLNKLSPTPPGPGHPFGVMSGVGVDVASALFRATPIDLVLVGGIILTAALIGLILGALAGYDRRGADLVVTNAAYILAGVPPFFFVLILFLGVQGFLTYDETLPVFGLMFVAVLWPYYALPVRARAQQVATEPYVEAARAAGASRRRIVWRHILPNSYFPLLAQMPVDIYNIFFVLTVFPFIAQVLGGSGGGPGSRSPTLATAVSALPQQPFPEWGYLLGQGAYWGLWPVPSDFFWWMFFFPALAIILFGLGVAFVCDGAERFVRTSKIQR